jgi:glutathione peroxidase
MKKTSILICLAIFMINCKTETKVVKIESQKTKSENNMKVAESIYQFKVKDLAGNDFDFSSLKGKKLLIVNTASKCGLTPQYKQLQEVYDLYGGENFEIIGFPANNFGKQEPGTDMEIASFCKENFGVTFPMMSKVSVKGSDMDDLYQFLTQENRNGLKDSEVSWNFQKYLIGADGKLVSVFSPKTLPDDASIVNWIKE